MIFASGNDPTGLIETVGPVNFRQIQEELERCIEYQEKGIDFDNPFK